jgi:hypothetical protein
MKTVSRVNPNRHGFIELLQDEDGNFYVTTPDDDDGEMFCANEEAAARARYDAEVEHYATTPNWELQAAYDAEHGTINGYAPWQYRDEF